MTLDLTRIELKHLITHHIGNKLRDEKYILTEDETSLSENTKDFLLRHFLSSIKSEELFSFSHTVRLDLNEVHAMVSDLFSKPKHFVNISNSLAKLLYEQSMHPRIKAGKLNIAYFGNIVLDDEVVDGIGIFKSESDVAFLKMKTNKTTSAITHDHGYEIKGIDRGCIVLNANQKEGYRIVVVDGSNKSPETQYWKDDFLKIEPIKNEFHQTKELLNITKEFVTKQLPDELDLSKADQIDLLNRSVEYFKTHQSFNQREFENEVFDDTTIIKSFRKYDSSYRQENDSESLTNFNISQQAVKTQSRIFKSVLKLDKNFHIYIHGDRALIEQGKEKDGRKFYKIYFENEF